MEHETPWPSQAVPSAGLQAVRSAVPSAPTPRGLAIELRELRARLRRAREREAAALDGGFPGCQPGEALKRFLAADMETATIVRRIKKIQAFTRERKDRPREGAGQT